MSRTPHSQVPLKNNRNKPLRFRPKRRKGGERLRLLAPVTPPCGPAHMVQARCGDATYAKQKQNILNSCAVLLPDTMPVATAVAVVPGTGTVVPGEGTIVATAVAVVPGTETVVPGTGAVATVASPTPTACSSFTDENLENECGRYIRGRKGRDRLMAAKEEMLKKKIEIGRLWARVSTLEDQCRIVLQNSSELAAFGYPRELERIEKALQIARNELRRFEIDELERIAKMKDQKEIMLINLGMYFWGASPSLKVRLQNRKEIMLINQKKKYKWRQEQAQKNAQASTSKA